MIVEVPISLGELVDKLSILKIKMEKIDNPELVAKAKHEADLLQEKLASLELNQIDSHLNGLIEINSVLWKIEDDIREKEKAGEFDEAFVELARNVYITNDQRFQLKRTINETYGSDVHEVKSYKG